MLSNFYLNWRTHNEFGLGPFDVVSCLKDLHWVFFKIPSILMFHHLPRNDSGKLCQMYHFPLLLSPFHYLLTILEVKVTKLWKEKKICLKPIRVFFWWCSFISLRSRRLHVCLGVECIFASSERWPRQPPHALWPWWFLLPMSSYSCLSWCIPASQSIY